MDITPSKLMQMYGYANRRCGPANGTHDPLFAKALVLEAGESRMAIVTTDLGSIISNNLREQVESKLHIPLLLLSTSHTHSAPSFLPIGSSPAQEPDSTEYLKELETKIFEAVEQASKTMFDARLGIARGSIPLGYTGDINPLFQGRTGNEEEDFNTMQKMGDLLARSRPMSHIHSSSTDTPSALEAVGPVTSLISSPGSQRRLRRVRDKAAQLG